VVTNTPSADMTIREVVGPREKIASCVHRKSVALPIPAAGIGAIRYPPPIAGSANRIDDSRLPPVGLVASSVRAPTPSKNCKHLLAGAAVLVFHLRYSLSHEPSSGWSGGRLLAGDYLAVQIATPPSIIKARLGYRSGFALTSAPASLSCPKPTVACRRRARATARRACPPTAEVGRCAYLLRNHASGCVASASAPAPPHI